MLNSQRVLAVLDRYFSDEILSSSEPYGLLTIELKSNRIKEVIKFLKLDLRFGFLTDICGIHYPENQGRELGVIYHLHNLKDNIRIRLKTFVSEENPTVESITDLFLGANWMERETFDFYGIQFKNHPDLRVILNAEDLGYHPMLKQYRLEDETRTDKDDKMFGR